MLNNDDYSKPVEFSCPVSNASKLCGYLKKPNIITQPRAKMHQHQDLGFIFGLKGSK